jgi:autotransporter family porin
VLRFAVAVSRGRVAVALAVLLVTGVTGAAVLVLRDTGGAGNRPAAETETGAAGPAPDAPSTAPDPTGPALGGAIGAVDGTPSPGGTASNAGGTASNAGGTASNAGGTASKPGGTASRAGGARSKAGAPARFATVPPSRALPTGAQCAAWVRANPSTENKGANGRANQTTGHRIGADFFGGDDPRADAAIGARVDGQFTGSTRDILRWTACKWGVDEDLVFAQAAIESWWQQGTLGDWTADASRCAPGRGLGADGRPGQCPESFGILQNRYPYERTGWPGIASSTAMNADLAYAIWRVCFEGYEGWLNTVERGAAYGPGDAWGCVGRWFSGRWLLARSESYIAHVQGTLSQRIWQTADFQEP